MDFSLFALAFRFIGAWGGKCDSIKLKRSTLCILLYLHFYLYFLNLFSISMIYFENMLFKTAFYVEKQEFSFKHIVQCFVLETCLKCNILISKMKFSWIKYHKANQQKMRKKSILVLSALQASEGVPIRFFSLLPELVEAYYNPNMGLVTHLQFPVQREEEVEEEPGQTLFTLHHNNGG